MQPRRGERDALFADTSPRASSLGSTLDRRCPISAGHQTGAPATGQAVVPSSGRRLATRLAWLVQRTNEKGRGAGQTAVRTSVSRASAAGGHRGCERERPPGAGGTAGVDDSAGRTVRCGQGAQGLSASAWNPALPWPARRVAPAPRRALLVPAGRGGWPCVDSLYSCWFFRPPSYRLSDGCAHSVRHESPGSTNDAGQAKCIRPANFRHLSPMSRHVGKTFYPKIEAGIRVLRWGTGLGSARPPLHPTSTHQLHASPPATRLSPACSDGKPALHAGQRLCLLLRERQI